MVFKEKYIMERKVWGFLFKGPLFLLFHLNNLALKLKSGFLQSEFWWPTARAEPDMD